MRLRILLQADDGHTLFEVDATGDEIEDLIHGDLTRPGTTMRQWEFKAAGCSPWPAPFPVDVNPPVRMAEATLLREDYPVEPGGLAGPGSIKRRMGRQGQLGAFMPDPVAPCRPRPQAMLTFHGDVYPPELVQEFKDAMDRLTCEGTIVVGPPDPTPVGFSIMDLGKEVRAAVEAGQDSPPGHPRLTWARPNAVGKAALNPAKSAEALRTMMRRDEWPLMPYALPVSLAADIRGHPSRHAGVHAHETAWEFQSYPHVREFVEDKPGTVAVGQGQSFCEALADLADLMADDLDDPEVDTSVILDIMMFPDREPLDDGGSLDDVRRVLRAPLDWPPAPENGCIDFIDLLQRQRDLVLANPLYHQPPETP